VRRPRSRAEASSTRRATPAFSGGCGSLATPTNSVAWRGIP
jgi:hypothetical protein